ncbi:MAG: hypothetical protein IIC73_00955 [Armatimonadetes bacterium]|nr:hypothetical protein [Armatimonadota bacterium]
MVRPKRSKVVLFVLATAVVAAVIAAWQLMSQGGGSKEDDLARAKAKIEEIGFTVDPDELGRRLYVPSDENAAPIIVSLGSKFASDGEIGRLLNEQENSADTCPIYHRQNPDVYEQLLEAAGKAGCDFGRDWSDGPKLLLPEIAQAKAMVRYSAILAKADANEGDYDGALQKLLVADRIGRHIGREPMIISKLVEYACRSIVLKAATEILADRPAEPATSDLVTRLGGSLRSLEDIRQGLQVGLIMGHVAIREYTPEEILKLDRGYTVKSGTGDRVDPNLRAAGEAVYMQRIVQLYDIWSRTNPAETVLSMTEAFDESVENDTQEGAEYTRIIMPVYSGAYHSSVVAGTATSMFRRLGQVVATIREDGIDVAVEKYDGRLADRVSGQEFRLTAVPGGFKFYSMGWDGKDDGGPDKIGYRFRNETNDDFGFWIPLGTG